MKSVVGAVAAALIVSAYGGSLHSAEGPDLRQPRPGLPVIESAALAGDGALLIHGVGLGVLESVAVETAPGVLHRLEILEKSPGALLAAAVYPIALEIGRRRSVVATTAAPSGTVRFEWPDPGRILGGAGEQRVVSLGDPRFGARGCVGEPGCAADDTAAFQRALDEAGEGGVLLVPPGNYALSSGLELPRRITVWSPGRATLIQACGPCDVFRVRGAESVLIDGMQFVYGARQLLVEASSGGSVRVENCEFVEAGGQAIDAAGGDTLFVSRSRFSHPRQALVTTFKRNLVRDSWVVAGLPNAPAGKAVFENGAGDLILENLLMNPRFGTGGERVRDARWVDNGGRFFAFGVRFGGEQAGIPIVRHRPLGGGDAVVIENSQLSAGGSFPGAGVLKAGPVLPSATWMEGNRRVTGSTYYGGRRHGAFLGVEADLVAVVAATERRTGNTTVFHLLANEIPVWDRGDPGGSQPQMCVPYDSMPEEVRGVISRSGSARKPVVPLILAGARAPAAILTREAARDCLVNVQDHGARGDGAGDDTRALSGVAAMRSFPRGRDARRYPAFRSRLGYTVATAPAILFPAGRYRISRAIRDFPSVVRIIGLSGADGSAPVLEQRNPEEPILDLSPAWIASLDGISFSGGRHAIRYENANIGTSELLVRGCEFADTVGMSILLEAPVSPANPDGRLSTNLVVEEAAFHGVGGALQNVGDLAVVRDATVSVEGGRPAFRNHYGALTFTGVRLRRTNVDSPWIESDANLNALGATLHEPGGGVFLSQGRVALPAPGGSAGRHVAVPQAPGPAKKDWDGVVNAVDLVWETASGPAAPPILVSIGEDPPSLVRMRSIVSDPLVVPLRSRSGEQDARKAPYPTAPVVSDAPGSCRSRGEDFY